MTWSISFSAPNKAAAQIELTMRLPQAMLGQKPHAVDYDLVKAMLSAAIGACAEGAFTVSANGHVNTYWAEPVPVVSGIYLGSVSVNSTPA